MLSRHVSRLSRLSLSLVSRVSRVSCQLVSRVVFVVRNAGCFAPRKKGETKELHSESDSRDPRANGGGKSVLSCS